jgi:hypothetical protein
MTFHGGLYTIHFHDILCYKYTTSSRTCIDEGLHIIMIRIQMNSLPDERNLVKLYRKNTLLVKLCSEAFKTKSEWHSVMSSIKKYRWRLKAESSAMCWCMRDMYEKRADRHRVTSLARPFVADTIYEKHPLCRRDYTVITTAALDSLRKLASPIISLLRYQVRRLKLSP